WLDITEHNQSEQRYRNLVETTKDFIWEINSKGVCTYASPQIFDILGYRPEEVIGKIPFDLMPKEEVERILPIFQQCVSQGSPLSTLEYMVYHKDGHIVFLESKSVPYYNSDGSLQGFRGIDRDITQHKKTEISLSRSKDELGEKVKEQTLELAESEEKYRQLVENANEIIVVSQEGLINFINNRGLEITGYSEKELLSKPFINFIHPDDRAMMIENYQKTSQGKPVPNNYEFRIICKDGSTKWVGINTANIQWQGKPATLGLISDITERKYMEQNLKAYAQKIIRVQEEERKRIAFELHDDTAQYLSILKMQIGALANSEEIQNPKIKEKLLFLERDADRAFQDVHVIAMN
ncbi:MAG: PAS domain S-box protein, partial [Dehalococcoidales bacterium]|nr:PAS domain S-box protein [Dehalococcoidales bacterium]